MPDVHTPRIRSKNMAAIRSRDTSPELIVRRRLHARGYRFRLHVKDLPGTPDLVFPKFRAVIFIHGCFWHRHGCSLFRVPRTRTEFWDTKLTGNAARDRRDLASLKGLSWRTAVVWECSLRGKTRIPAEVVTDFLSEWLQSDRQSLEVAASAAYSASDDLPL